MIKIKPIVVLCGYTFYLIYKKEEGFTTDI